MIPLLSTTQRITHLIYMEYQVQFTYVFKTLVQRFHENLDQVENAKLTLRRVHAKNEIQRSIMSVDQTIILSTNEPKQLDAKNLVAKNLRSTLEKVANVVISARN